MGTRTKRTYGNLIIRLGLLLAIAVLSYAKPIVAVVGQPCEITKPSPGITCAKCDNNDDGCWGAACCTLERDEDGNVTDIDCITDHGCEDEEAG